MAIPLLESSVSLGDNFSASPTELARSWTRKGRRVILFMEVDLNPILETEMEASAIKPMSSL